MITHGFRRRRSLRSGRSPRSRVHSGSSRVTGRIPYTPEALARKQENVENWVDRDPEIRCHLPGIPRAMYMPYPFEITQSTNKVHMAFAYTATARTIHMDEVELPPDYTWMAPRLAAGKGTRWWSR